MIKKILIGLILVSAFNSVSAQSASVPGFMIIAHRGARGAMPENSIPAMKKAIDLGANTIELDVHISKDKQVVVYHDASMNPEYTRGPGDIEIAKEKRKDFTLYQMNYEDIRRYDIGSKYYAAFPNQQKFKVVIPTLPELIDSVEEYTRLKGLPGVFYLVEIKSNASTDGVEQPSPEEYMKILMASLAEKKLGSRLLIQSFDIRQLKVLNEKYPGHALGFLTGDKTKSFSENLQQLGFTPTFYNPNQQLVTDTLIRECHAKKIKITPWTVNEPAEIEKLVKMGVDGIISDYPDRVVGVKKQN